MRTVLLWVLIGAFAAAVRPGTAVAQQDDMQWALWRSAYISADGRVIDAPGGDISHSEGQGYAMLLAVAHTDPTTFAKLWGWTSANLQVRDDGLLAWRWDSGWARASPTETMRPTATYWWPGPCCRPARPGATRHTGMPRPSLPRAALDHASTEVAGRVVLIPGVDGFSSPDGGVVLNLSYWVFPALLDFKTASGDARWGELVDSGLALIDQATDDGQVPPDWVALHPDGRLNAPPKQPYVVGYNAYRIPLYLLWAGLSKQSAIRRFDSLWGARAAGMPMIVDAASGRVLERSLDTGYLGLPALVSCVLSTAGFSDPPPLRAAEPYYPSTPSDADPRGPAGAISDMRAPLTLRPDPHNPARLRQPCWGPCLPLRRHRLASRRCCGWRR